jgi:hypothetical protein
VGLGGLIAIGWVIALIGQAGGLVIGVWWAAVLSVVLAGGGWWALSRTGVRQDAVEGDGWFAIVARPVGHWIGAVFGLNWLYRSLFFLYRLLQQLVNFFSMLLEGQGGVLWALLLLALLSTLIGSSVSL